MNIVITGGTGFIGSNLCKKLLLEGNKITCIDNNFTGSIETGIVSINYNGDSPENHKGFVKLNFADKKLILII